MKASELFALSQEFTVNESTVAITTAGVQKLCEANAARVALLIGYAHNIGSLTLTTKPDATVEQGLIIGATGPTALQLYYSQTGALCQKAWYANGGTNGILLTLVEVLFRQ